MAASAQRSGSSSQRKWPASSISANFAPGIFFDNSSVPAGGRTTTQRFGTTASWLVDVLNVLTGNLDRWAGHGTAGPHDHDLVAVGVQRPAALAAAGRAGRGAQRDLTDAGGRP